MLILHLLIYLQYEISFIKVMNKLKIILSLSVSLILFIAKPAISQVTLTNSNLPIVCIYSYGHPILPDTNIICDMGIIYNGPGGMNNINDPFNNYNGKISIRKRGCTSLNYPKHSYTFETQDSEGQSLNVSLIDLPEENDWILYGPYPDKSLMRNVLIYELARKMGRYAPRTKYCEVILDNEYIGVYVLIEKIKRDNNRVDISKLSPNDTTGDNLTGGYILKIDRWEGAGWTSEYVPNVYFEYEYPDDDEIVPMQKSYIQSFINTFEDSLFNLSTLNNTALINTIDFESFIDYIILNELSKNADGYRLSTYLYKNKDSNDGRINMGPIWDYDLAFGNYCEFFAYLTENFIYSDTTFWNNAPFWFRKLMTFELFQNKVRCRWEELRINTLHEDSIVAIIDSCYNFLYEAQQRNFEKWDILGSPIWPNYYYGETYEEEIEILKDWIFERMNWLDENFPGQCFTTQIDYNDQDDNFSFIIYPNPVNFFVTIGYNLSTISSIYCKIYDQYGRLIRCEFKECQPAGAHKLVIDTENLNPGMYFLQMIINGKDVEVKSVIKIIH